jgi:hypothetical protein
MRAIGGTIDLSAPGAALSRRRHGRVDRPIPQRLALASPAPRIAVREKGSRSRRCSRFLDGRLVLLRQHPFLPSTGQEGSKVSGRSPGTSNTETACLSSSPR